VRKKTRIFDLLITSVIVFSFFANLLILKPAAATSSYTAQYWNLDDPTSSPTFPTGSPDFSGSEAEIALDWGAGSPDDSINNDGFTARFTKTAILDAGTYYFNTYSDDGVRVYIDDNLVIDAWYDQGGEVHLGNPTLSAGSHEIMIEYYENGGAAYINFSYGILDGADAVLGQEKLSTNNYDNNSTNSTGFDDPRAVAVDGVNHRLFVADEENNRVVVYNLNTNNFLIENTADYVLGQTDLASGYCNNNSGPTAKTLCEPYALSLDTTNNRLFVADSENNRVLVYDVASISNGEAAVNVLGQPNFTSNNCCTLDANETGFIESMTYDSNNQRLFIGDGHRRVLVFDVASITNNEDAVNVLGQADFETEDQHCYYEPDITAAGFCNYATGLTYDTANDWLFVSDQANYRVMVFDAAAITDGEDAVHVLGQPDLTTGNCCSVTAGTISDARGLTYDVSTKRLFVGDAGFSGANRILVYDLNTFTDGEDAVNVLGHDDFTSSNCNTPSGTPAVDNLCGPYGTYFDTNTGLLYVADTFNHRVMMFDVDAITDGEDAYNMFGQDDFIYNPENGRLQPNAHGLDGPFSLALDTSNHRLFVGDRWNYRVLVYNLDTNNRINDNTADIVIGQPDFNTSVCETNINSLCETQGLAYDATNERLFVSDRNNSRIMVFDVDPDTLGNEPDAINVLGQPDFDSFSCNNGGRSATSLCQPFHLAYDSGNGYLWAADKSNSRVLGYNVAPGTLADNMAATKLLGQSAFNAGTCDRGGSTADNTLCQERGVAVNSSTHELYVTDGSNVQRNRVMVFDGNPGTMTNGESATHVLGQDNFTDIDCNQDNSDPDISTLCNPNGVTLDQTRNLLYVHDEYNHRIVTFDVASITDGEDGVKILGQNAEDQSDCNWDSNYPESYTLCTPISSTVNQTTGDLFVADTWNNRVVQYNYVAGATDDDSDNDGVLDSVEEAGPNSGDANNDGTADVDQDNVTSLVDPVTGAYAVLESPSSCSNLSVAIAAESANTVADSGYNYPAGLMNFTLACGTPGATVAITMYYYNVSPTGLVTRKYNSNTNGYSAISGAVVTAVTVGGQAAAKVAYSIVDGGSLDLDETANGNIVDPTGLALSVVGAPNTGLGGTYRRF
jgi:sugar lactone lactonase YvrE